MTVVVDASMGASVAIFALMAFASPALAKCDGVDARSNPRQASGPALPSCQFVVRLKLSDTGALDAWIAKQPDPKPSREEAIRRLIIERVKEVK